MTKRALQKALLCLFCPLLVAMGAEAAEKLPAADAGEIPANPVGKIAFIREGSIWMMNADGATQEKVSEVVNADGRLTWSPDGKQIVFTRAGMVDLKGPDMLGGTHKVYDLFMANLDSVYANNRLWWIRLTTDVGSRDPEWSYNSDTLVFWKDMEANRVNAVEPNYQPAFMTAENAIVTLIRKDWQRMDEFLISPSRNVNGQLAAVYFFHQKAQGLVVLNPDEYMLPEDSLRARALKHPGRVAPAWSPDSKWIAFVSNNLNDPGLFITNPDQSKTYLVFVPPVGTQLYTFAPSWSPDGKWLTFSSTDGSVWISKITGEGARRLTGPGLDKAPAWSKGPVPGPGN